MPVHEIKHPLVQHKISLMRAKDMSTRNFRQLSAEVGSLLTYEATKDLQLEDFQMDGWDGELTGQRLVGKKATVVPILRAGSRHVRWRVRVNAKRKNQCGRSLP